MPVISDQPTTLLLIEPHLTLLIGSRGLDEIQLYDGGVPLMTFANGLDGGTPSTSYTTTVDAGTP